MVQPAQADWLAKLHTDYPSAVRRLEELYSEVWIVALDIGPKDRLKKVEYLRSGDFVRKVSEHDGVTRAAGGNRRSYFFVEKKSPDVDLVVLDYGPHLDFDESTRLSYKPIYAPFCAYEVKVADYLQQSNVKAISATPIKLEVRDVIEVVAHQTTETGMAPSRFWFLPEQGWALAGGEFELPGKDGTLVWIETRVHYEPGDPPRIKAVEVFNRNSAHPAERRHYQKYEILTLEFGKIPKEAFDITAFGVAEPSTIIRSCG